MLCQIPPNQGKYKLSQLDKLEAICNKLLQIEETR